MGFSVLDLVLLRLREAGFQADVAYPGQKYPTISDTVAAVHIEQVDRANVTVTVEITVLCPAAMGGTACEVAALRATEILRWSGAECIQNGCTYDGISQVYAVSILATFTGITGEDSFVKGPGFEVRIDGILQTNATAFSSEEIREYQPEYAMGESAPVGMGKGTFLWKFSLEEQIPAGSPPDDEPTGIFEVMLITNQKTETFRECRFTSATQQYTREGLRRIRNGISMLREET